jgi:putative transposase
VPAPSRTAHDPPQRTPSFVCEVPLQVHSAQEHTLLARLEAARQVYNACLGEARKRARLVHESKVFQQARALSKDDPERKRLFREARAHHAFSDYALQAYAQPFLLSWLGEHLDSHTIQKLASRAYAAANRVLVGKAKRVRFKGKEQLDSVEGKVNTSGIRWCGDHVEWRGLVLPALLYPRDVVEAYGLACPVKYVRLVRRKLGLRHRFYAQLVCEGTPYRKPQHQLGTGVMGLDLGPSTIAMVGEQEALLQPFCPEVTPNWQHVRRLDRKLDRQRRANNPEYYDERGRVKKGKKCWKVSKRQRQVQARRREVYRRLAATRKRSHGQLAHQVLTLGGTFQLEKISYRAWQKQFGRSIGRSAPGMFVSLLSRLAASAGGKVVELNTRRAKLSQRCHCGAVVKKPLRQRWHVCACGVSAQRDLYSAHLARFVNPHTTVLKARQAAVAWRRGEPLVQAAYQHAIENQRASGRPLPSSFGQPPGGDPSQSASPAEGRPANAESRDAVARRQRRARARKRRR